jgi:hypothetical protein
MNIKKGVVVIDTECATEFALAEKVIKRNTCSNRDARPELMPSQTTVVHRVDEVLEMY